MAKKPKQDKTEAPSEAEYVEEVAEVAPVPDVSKDMAEDAEIIPASEETDVKDINEHEVEHEEHHFSLAAKSLQILALVGAGAVIGIWAAPRIAPMLPVGMAPVAQWLSPSNNAAEEDLENLRVALESRLVALETLPTRDEIETRLANFQTDTVNPVRAQMTALSDQVAAADSTAVESRLWALEGRVEGLIAEINSMTNIIGDIAAEGGAISADTAASISAYRTRIDGLQASLNEMASLQGALSQRIDEVAATSKRQVVEAEILVEEANQQSAQVLQDTEIQTSFAAIEAALKSGADFTAPLARIANSTGISIPAALAAAQNGTQTLEDLQSDFVPAAHAAIRAAITSDEDAGLLSSFGSFLRSQVTTRSLTPQAGDSADAILSRMEAALQRADLTSVLSESEALPPKAAAEMAAWLGAVREQNAVSEALTELRNSIGLEDNE